MNKILEKERLYCNEYNNLSIKLNELYEDLLSVEDFDLEGTYITKAVLQRLVSYYQHQNAVKTLLNKRYTSAAADFFVETLLFYLKVMLSKYAPELEVESERAIVNKRGALRPDISIWKGDKVLAIIECKTQLGWNRDGWEEDFKKRERKLLNVYPDANAYLIVLSGANWHGFGENENLNRKYFLISDIWPGSVTTIENLDISNSVELYLKAFYLPQGLITVFTKNNYRVRKIQKKVVLKL